MARFWKRLSSQSWLRFGVFILALAGLLAQSGCVTLEVYLEQTPTPDIRLTGTISALQAGNNWLATQIALPTQTPVPPTITPKAPTPGSTGGTPFSANRFSNLRFSTQPDAISSEQFYVAGVPRIYAVWDYTNMHAGMQILRVWHRNGVEWIRKEETWDMPKYGSAGTIRDVSIFDEAIGMQPGEYSLSLYVDGVLQDLGEGASNLEKSTFWIFASDVQGGVSSPNGSLTAWVQRGGHLLIEDQNGKQRELVVTQEISNVAWFPDNLHLIYTERDRSQQVNASEDWGITHKLWILDTSSGERHLVAASGEDFHNPVISPNGRYIAVLSGSTYGDACLSSPTLVFIELDGELRRQAIYLLNNFKGFPYTDSPNSGIYPTDHTSPGHWDGDQTFVASLWWSCLNAPSNPNGIYLLDLGTREAQRIGN